MFSLLKTVRIYWLIVKKDKGIKSCNCITKIIYWIVFLGCVGYRPKRYGPKRLWDQLEWKNVIQFILHTHCDMQYTNIFMAENALFSWQVVEFILILPWT